FACSAGFSFALRPSDREALRRIAVHLSVSEGAAIRWLIRRRAKFLAKRELAGERVDGMGFVGSETERRRHDAMGERARVKIEKSRVKAERSRVKAEKSRVKAARGVREGPEGGWARVKAARASAKAARV